VNREDQPGVDRWGYRRGLAALNTEAPVLEGFGPRNFGSHSNDAEYVNISSIEPRLYLLTRMIMDVSDGKIATGK